MWWLLLQRATTDVEQLRNRSRQGHAGPVDRREFTLHDVPWRRLLWAERDSARCRQQYAYIVKALEGFRDGRRTNDGGSMRAVVHGVSNQDIEALAQYIASLN